LGNLYLILNRPLDATNVLEPAARDEPLNIDARALLAEAYAKNLHLESAIKEYQAVVARNPSDAMAWGRIGLYHVSLTRYAEAREPLQKAIQLDPMEPHYYWAMGDSYLLESPDDAHFNKAAQYYRQALNLNPKNAKALYSFAMGLSRHGKPEDLKEALTLFERLVQINPNDMNANYKLAEAYRLLGRDAEAKRHQDRFLVLFEKGRKQNRDLYKRAAFLDTPTAHLQRGQKALQEGNYRVAKLEFDQALRLDETSMEARRGVLAAQKGLGTFSAEPKKP
jgi:tetratricopeptide (TPR) repeat protein